MSVPVEDPKQRAASQAFHVGMFYLRQALFPKDSNPELAEEGRRNFMNLLVDATIDVFSAVYPPAERPAVHLCELNKQRQLVWEALVKARQYSLPEANQMLPMLDNLVWNTYDLYCQAVRNLSNPPALRLRTVSIPHVIAHDELPPDVLELAIMGIDWPDRSTKLTLRAGFEAPTDEFPSLQSGATLKLPGLPVGGDIGRRQRTEVQIALVRPRTLRMLRSDEVRLGKFTLKPLARKCVAEISCDVNAQGERPVRVTLRCTLRTPIEGPEVEIRQVPLLIATQFLPAAPEPEPAAQPPPPPPQPPKQQPKQQPKQPPKQTGQPPKQTVVQEDEPQRRRPPPSQPPAMPYILGANEWDEFMTPALIGQIKVMTKVGIAAFTSRRLAVPPELEAQIQLAEQKLAALGAREDLTEELIQDLIEQQIAAHEQRLAEMPVDDDPARKHLEMRLNLLKQELEQADE